MALADSPEIGDRRLGPLDESAVPISLEFSVTVTTRTVFEPPLRVVGELETEGFREF